MNDRTKLQIEQEIARNPAQDFYALARRFSVTVDEVYDIADAVDDANRGKPIPIPLDLVELIGQGLESRFTATRKMSARLESVARDVVRMVAAERDEILGRKLIARARAQRSVS